MVNQIEVHPSLSQVDLRAYCIQHDIAVTSWAPLGTGIVFSHPIIKRLAAKYEKTPAQIILHWQLEVGNIVIPKSVTKERLEENLQLFDFALTANEVAEVATLNTFHRTSLNPDDGYINPNF